MDKRKNILRNLKVCRFCLSEDFPLGSMYDRSRAPKNTVTLPLQILSCVSIEIYPSDGMPKQICERCRYFMDLTYHFKQICRQADESIFQYVENGDALAPISWPTKLVKLFRSSGEGAGGKESVKTLVTEGGACIQVQTDSEDDADADNDEKAFNIKIEGDGSESASKKGSSFKIITGNEKVKIMNNDPTTAKQEGAGGSRADRWPCDDCHCTYPLQQLLQLHRAQKHRRREVVCDLCGDKFFTKYDLTTHQLRHSDEMPFECVACDKKFNRLVLLKRHEKSKHADLPQYLCPECPVTFLSEEELVAHQQRHRQYAVRPYTCQLCNKKFYTNRAVQRHKEAVHGARRPYACDLCPQRYSTGPKLARHVRTHVRGADYPCKYCNKVFQKSHHYTRHLRLKHKESSDRSPRSAFGPSMQFRCDQCEEAFETQDDLIYHSAYHATQNLICPLCQEKFEDVDAVTAHIKSHVDSEQFMCDLCELVFTSKERLDLHLSTKHEEELRQEQEQSVDLGEDDSMELEATEEEEEEDHNFSVKDEGDHMVVEIKKPSEFTISKVTDTSQIQEKPNKTNEEANMEVTYTELSTVDTLAIAKQQIPAAKAKPVASATVKTPVKEIASPVKVITKTSATTANSSTEAASILRKAEEVKRKGLERREMQLESSSNGKSDKAESSISTTTAAGASDKTIRLLEKELRELQRTSSARSETGKTPAPPVDSMRGRRPQIHTSTPKPKSIESRKLMLAGKHVEKKLPERAPVLTKDNKDSKENRESKNNNNNTGVKDDKEAKEQKAKAVVKNGAESGDESAMRVSRDDSVRRSSRPSKIKDYAKMIRESTQESSADDDDTDDGDDEYNQEAEVVEKLQTRGRPRKVVQKPLPKPATVPRVESATPFPPRKRGRPRKAEKTEPSPVQTKAKKPKSETSEENDESQQISRSSQKTTTDNETLPNENDLESAEEKCVPTTPKPSAAGGVANLNTSPGGSSSVLLSPTGQTLKKIPIKALPPGVKALPLPVNSRAMGGVCEMQIGQKVMKVQKIVMTKDKVEQLAKQGLIEVKDGTMVLKTGYKLAATGDSTAKAGAADAEVNKDGPVKKDKPAPTRCDLDPEEP